MEKIAHATEFMPDELITLEESLMLGVVDDLDPALGDEFIDDNALRWIETHFRIPETPDHHIWFTPHQKFMLNTALIRINAGKFPYSIVIWSDIKKSAKSTITAAVGLWRAFQCPWGSIKVVANDLKQADSRVSYYMRRPIELHPVMRQMVNVTPSGIRLIFLITVGSKQPPLTQKVRRVVTMI